MGKEEYTLYIGSYQRVDDCKYVYSSGTSDYTLVFTNKAPNDDFKPVLKEKEYLLNEDERHWLAQCKLAVNTEALIKNQNDYTALLNEFLNCVEKELQKQGNEKEEEK